MDASDVEWTCPALPAPGTELQTWTYHHAPEMSGPVALGVDEAGRGPVLGPMVYGIAYCPLGFKTELSELNYDDSKVLSAEVRHNLMKKLTTDPHLRENIGWATTIMTAADISAGMLRPGIPYNLNEQAHDTTIALIQRVLDSGVAVEEVYVDTVGPPDKYQIKLQRRFPQIREIIVTKKADSLYPIVSCASICAKVTRDASLVGQISDCGSGYPADPNTTAWLTRNMDRVFGWGPVVRYSWGTAKTLLDDACGVRWATPIVRPREDALPTISNYFGEPY